jgi:putative ATP-dependent endonuclease of the OLD family
MITITIGELADALKNMEAYGRFLRSFSASTGEINEEPENQAETVLTLNLKVGSDLEPVWTLISARAAAEGHARYLTWGDRVKLCPTRIGVLTDYNLAWRRGSVLNRLSDERADTSAALARAGREARGAFGELAEEQLGETLAIVAETAKQLGIPTGGRLRAMLDAHSVSFGGGAISLHGEDGVPLRALGIGSTRLLVAGLQRRASDQSTVVLMDELEYGLEPHRILRLLSSLGAKEAVPPLQAFITTHSPVALRALSADQLVVVRRRQRKHAARFVGEKAGVQGTVRLFPEAFLAPSVLICEGASEVGFVRGLDQHRVAMGNESMTARGTAIVDAGGCDQLYTRANAFLMLEYRTAVLRDDDQQPDADIEEDFMGLGGSLSDGDRDERWKMSYFSAYPAKPSCN